MLRCSGGRCSSSARPIATAGRRAWRIEQARRQAGRRLQAAQGEAGADRHQAERQRGQADALQRRRHRLGQHQAEGVAGQAEDGADDQRIARDLAGHREWPPWRASGQTAATLQIGIESAHQERHPGQPLSTVEPLGQRQRDVRVEAVGDLRARGMEAAVDAGPAADRQGDGDADRQHADAGQAEVERLRRLERALQDRVEEQHRKEQEVDEPLGRVPDAAVERGAPADDEAEQDQQEVGQQEQGFATGTSMPTARRGLAGGRRQASWPRLPRHRFPLRSVDAESPIPARQRRPFRRRARPGPGPGGLSEQAGAADRSRSPPAAPPTSLPASSPRRSTGRSARR